MWAARIHAELTSAQSNGFNDRTVHAGQAYQMFAYDLTLALLGLPATDEPH